MIYQATYIYISIQRIHRIKNICYTFHVKKNILIQQCTQLPHTMNNPNILHKTVLNHTEKFASSFRVAYNAFRIESFLLLLLLLQQRTL